MWKGISERLSSLKKLDQRVIQQKFHGPLRAIVSTICVFFHKHSRITVLQGKGISLSPHYHFNPLHRHWDISRAITAGSSPLHIASSWNRTGNLWFPSARTLARILQSSRSLTDINIFSSMWLSILIDLKCFIFQWLKSRLDWWHSGGPLCLQDETRSM